MPNRKVQSHKVLNRKAGCMSNFTGEILPRSQAPSRLSRALARWFLLTSWWSAFAQCSFFSLALRVLGLDALTRFAAIWVVIMLLLFEAREIAHRHTCDGPHRRKVRDLAFRRDDGTFGIPEGWTGDHEKSFCSKCGAASLERAP